MEPEEAVKDHILSGEWYDRLKFVAQLLLPGLGTLYFALSGIWGFGAAEQVVGTIVAIDTFLGVLLQVSTASYNASDTKYDGSISILDKDENGQNFSLKVPANADHIIGKKELKIKVNPPK